MLKLLVKLGKDMSTIEVSAQKRGEEILSTVKDFYEKDTCGNTKCMVL